MRLLLWIVGLGLLLAAGSLAALLAQGPPDPEELGRRPVDEGLGFQGVLGGVVGATSLERFETRDGSVLTLRRYAAESNRFLLLAHGSGSDGLYLAALASRIADAGAANVVTPDLRGHGPSPARRGDVDHQDQMVEDLADLVASIRAEHPDARIAVGGHSSGGGLALRYGGSAHGSDADALLLLAPFLRHDAPTMRPNAGGWAHPAVGRIIALSILNGFGIHALDHLPTISFQMPAEVRPGTETLVYTHRLNAGFAPASYTADLEHWKKPLQVFVGSEDEAFIADRFAAAIAPHAPHAEVTLLPDLSHLGLATSPTTADAIVTWLDERSGL